MMASETPPSVTWSFLVLSVIGVTEVIGSIPSISTSASCSTNARIALSSPRRFSTSPSATAIRARWATRRTVSLSTDMSRCLLKVYARAYRRGLTARQRRRLPRLSGSGGRQRRVLRWDADRKNRGVENGEDERIERQSQRQRHRRDLAGPHRIVGMTQLCKITTMTKN